MPFKNSAVSVVPIPEYSGCDLVRIVSSSSISSATATSQLSITGYYIVKFYNNNTTEIKGNLVVTDGVSFGTFPDAYMQIYGNVNIP